MKTFFATLALIAIGILIILMGLYMGKTTVDSSGIEVERPFTMFFYFAMVVAIIIEDYSKYF